MHIGRRSKLYGGCTCDTRSSYPP